MNPDTRLYYTLIASLLVWSPAAIAMATGGLDIMRGGLIYVAGLVLSWIGTGFLQRIVENYRASNKRVEDAKREIERLEARHERAAERRRKQDERSTDDD